MKIKTITLKKIEINDNKVNKTAASNSNKTADLNLPDSVLRLDKMIKKDDWINSNKAYNGGVRKV